MQPDSIMLVCPHNILFLNSNTRFSTGLRGIGLPDAVCPSNAIDGSCMAWGTWMGAQFDEKTLYVKFGPANVTPRIKTTVLRLPCRVVSCVSFVRD